MSSSSPRTSGAEPKAWFHDWKSGCEKQAHYFVRIQKLQQELIHHEQHNLINAMERLEQLTYPRKKPVVHTQKFLQQSSEKRTGFPAKPHNLRKGGKYRMPVKKEKVELKPLTGKPLAVEKTQREDHSQQRFDFERLLRIPLLSEQDVARIIATAQTISPKEPSAYLLQPHLPSIPSVGRRANLVQDNRLRLLTLAGGEADFPELESDITGTQKRLHTSKSQWRTRKGKNKSDNSDLTNQSSDLERRKKEKKNNMLVFDVDPNDPSLFSHCVDGSTEWENQSNVTTPLPPPNSRPTSGRCKTLEVHLDNSRVDEVEETENPPETVDSLTILEVDNSIDICTAAIGQTQGSSENKLTNRTDGSEQNTNVTQADQLLISERIIDTKVEQEKRDGEKLEEKETLIIVN